MYPKNVFFQRSAEMLSDMYDCFQSCPSLKISGLDARKTSLIIVDIINGFIKGGRMSDIRLARLLPICEGLLNYCRLNGIATIFFADSHEPYSTQLERFPEHCIRGSRECEEAEGLKRIGGYTLIRKNSVNGFHETEFRKFLKHNDEIENFVVCGVCTDICVMNLCMSLKTYFDSCNVRKRVLVPITAFGTTSISFLQIRR